MNESEKREVEEDLHLFRHSTGFGHKSRMCKHLSDGTGQIYS